MKFLDTLANQAHSADIHAPKKWPDANLRAFCEAAPPPHRLTHHLKSCTAPTKLEVIDLRDFRAGEIVHQVLQQFAKAGVTVFIFKTEGRQPDDLKDIMHGLRQDFPQLIFIRSDEFSDEQAFLVTRYLRFDGILIDPSNIDAATLQFFIDQARDLKMESLVLADSSTSFVAALKSDAPILLFAEELLGASSDYWQTLFALKSTHSAALARRFLGCLHPVPDAHADRLKSLFGQGFRMLVW